MHLWGRRDDAIFVLLIFLFKNIYYYICFKRKKGRAHQESLCRLQIVFHVTKEQNIHKGEQVNRNGLTSNINDWSYRKKHDISVKIMERHTCLMIFIFIIRGG